MLFKRSEQRVSDLTKEDPFFSGRGSLCTLPLHLRIFQFYYKVNLSSYVSLPPFVPIWHFQHLPVNPQARLTIFNQRIMCIIFRFYHLCGHVHRVTTFPCTYAPTQPNLQPRPEDELASSQPGSLYRPPVACLSDPAESPEKIRLFPTLCAKCEQVGVICEWLDRAPGGRFDIIRAWNKTHKPQLHKVPKLESEIAELESFKDMSNDDTTTSLYSDETDALDQQSSTTLVNSPHRTNTSSRSHRTQD